jgi:two-component system nitrogen regulation response regulator GlnG
MARLLVIDDEANVRFSLQEGLQSPTLQVLTAATARQGLELLREQMPDAVLIDVLLPDMSGLDAFRTSAR